MHSQPRKACFSTGGKSNEKTKNNVSLANDLKDVTYVSLGDDGGGPSLCSLLIAALSLLLVLATVPFSLYMCVKVILSQPTPVFSAVSAGSPRI